MNISSNHYLAQLEDWDLIRKLLFQELHLKDNINSFVESTNIEDINHIFEQTKRFENFDLDNQLIDISKEINLLNPDCTLDLSLKKLSKTQVLSFDELNQLFICLEVIFKYSTQVKALFNSHDFKFLDTNSKLNAILSNFRSFINQAGEIDYMSHPQLSKLFQEKNNLQKNIRQELNNFIHSAEITHLLQHKSLDLIENKYIIPIRSDSYNKSLGTIVFRSESGNTLYIEPPFIQKSNERYNLLSSQIEHIISTLEYEFSNDLSKELNLLENFTFYTKLLDQYIARSKFSLKLGLQKPILSDSCSLRMNQAFYPLIENPIKNDILLLEDYKGLIISGPNTGGKSITLKIIFLSQILIRYGLYIPAENSNIFLFENIQFFSGDKQDILNNLSSFAAEVKGFVHLFSCVKQSNLIVIDEIFNTTSSEEASALAMSLFMKIAELSKSKIIVSTHHQTLKSLLHQNSTYLSAHMGFNTENLEPNYKLILDSPGSSHAISIFNKLTHNSELNSVAKNATKFLDNNFIHYEKLLSKLAKKEHDLLELERQNRSLNLDLRNQLQKSEGLLKLQRSSKLEDFEGRLNSFFKTLEKKLSEPSSKKLQKAISESKQYLSNHKELLRPEQRQNLKKASDFLEGQFYYSDVLKKDVQLIRFNLSKKQATVISNNKNITCSLDTLYLPQNHSRQKKSPSVSVNITSSPSTKLEFDCRGMRLEEFKNLLFQVELYLVNAEIPFALIIHGHGDGVLKKYLFNFIRTHKSLMFDKDESGNDGASRIVIA